MHPVVLALLAPAAASPSPSPSAGPNPDLVSPGLLGFLSIVFLVVAVYFIGRGLNKQLRRVDFDEDAASAALTGDEAPAADPAPAEAAPAPPVDEQPAG